MTDVASEISPSVSGLYSTVIFRGKHKAVTDMKST